MIKLTGTTTRQKFLEYASYVLNGGYIMSDEKQLDKIIADFDNGKSLLVIGNGGAGKTLFFKLLQPIIHPKSENRFLYAQCNNLVLDFNINGHKSFLRYNDYNVCFDDLGTEDMGKYFGDTVNVMEKFILHRYELYYSKKLCTHFTSNLTLKEVYARYGLRCEDRLKEMCQFYVMGGGKDFKSRRGLKNFKAFPSVFHEMRTKEQIEWDENYNRRKEEIRNKKVNESPPAIKGSGTRLKEAITELMPNAFKETKEDVKQLKK